MKTPKRHPNILKSNSGFIVADFLFSFVMILGVGIFIFALTFSLATIEVAQYIVWSTARNYAAATTDAATQSDELAREKFENLATQFPKLTGVGEADSPWFQLTVEDLKLGNLADTAVDPEFSGLLSADDRNNSFRQPWVGVSTNLTLVLFSSLQLPFLGKVATDPSLFTLPVRAFVIRHPSRKECRDFFYEKRYTEGIEKLEEEELATGSFERADNLTGSGAPPTTDGGFGEDNGC